MKQLFYAEIKKFIRPYHRRVLLFFIIIFPFLYMTLSTSTDVQSDRKEKDAIRNEISGVVDEEWFMNVEKVIANETKGETYEEQLRYHTLTNAYETSLQLYQNRISILQNENTPTIIKENIKNSVQRYGPHEDWDVHFDVLHVSALLYGICCIYLFCDIYNQEEESGAIELIKSSKYGRLPFISSKIMSTILVSLVLGFIVYGMVQMASFLMLEKSTAISVISELHYLTYGEANAQFFWLFVMGGLICATLSLFFSCITKSMSVSLSLGIITYVVPSVLSMNFLNTDWEGFFPVSFLQEADSILNQPWLQIYKFNGSIVTCIAVVWIPISILLIGYCIWAQKDKKVFQIIKVRK